jgi:hypothetical protein
MCSERKRAKRPCQSWKEVGINDTRMDCGTGCGAHRIVERRDLRQRNWSPIVRHEKCGHRQSLPPPIVQTPTVVSDPSGRPECYPTGATRSGHVQLAPGYTREGWVSLLRRGGCSGETLLPYALQSGLYTSSQRPKDYCGRLTFAAGDSRDIAYPENRRSNVPPMGARCTAVIRCIISLLCMRRCVSGQAAVHSASVAGPFCTFLAAKPLSLRNAIDGP